MLLRKYGPNHRIAVCERRPNIPPSPFDKTVWCDVARFYLMGIDFRGQNALRECGVFEDFEKASVAIHGRRDWQPSMTRPEDGKVTPAKKAVVSRVLARDKLVGLLYHHIVEKYANASIDLLYGYEIEPLDFYGDEKNDSVTVRISACGDILSITPDPAYVPSQESDVLCDADESWSVSTSLLVGADGSARTIANTMETVDSARWEGLSPFQKTFAPRPFRVKRYKDDNPRVFKSVQIKLPEDWPSNLNYSARSTNSRMTLEALPSDEEGSYCALMLMRPDDELAKPNEDPSEMRAFFDAEFPQFSALIDDEEMARTASKEISTLPAFRYVGPRLNIGKRTLLLGDAAHTVKPYFGLGANTALDDVMVFSRTLDDATMLTESEGKHIFDPVPSAVKLYSKRRVGDSTALVQISRNMDRPGKLFFVTFLLPLILDGIFHKVAPKIFDPNIFSMFQKQNMGFKQIQQKKRLDRTLQVIFLGMLMGGAGLLARLLVVAIALVTGRRQGSVTVSAVAVAAALWTISQQKKKVEAKA